MDLDSESSLLVSEEEEDSTEGDLEEAKGTNFQITEANFLVLEEDLIIINVIFFYFLFVFLFIYLDRSKFDTAEVGTLQ